MSTLRPPWVSGPWPNERTRQRFVQVDRDLRPLGAEPVDVGHLVALPVVQLCAIAECTDCGWRGYAWHDVGNEPAVPFCPVCPSS